VRNVASAYMCFLKMSVKMWFVNGKASNHAFDESEIELVHKIVNVPCTTIGKPPSTGWPDNVIQAFMETITVVGYSSIPNMYPFIVGGVGCASVEQYRMLQKVAALGNAWNILMEQATLEHLETLQSAIADLDSMTQFILPPNTLLARVLQNKENIKNATASISLIQSQADDALTLPANALAESYKCIDITAIAQRIIGNNVVHFNTMLENNFDLTTLYDAKSWVNCYVGKDVTVQHAAANIALMHTSAERTHQDVVVSTVADAAIAQWGCTEYRK